jgi:hypothetical protein
MTSINSFYRDPNAVANATRLFSNVKAQAPQANPGFSNPGFQNSQKSDEGMSLSSGQRALARIIEILSLGDSATKDQANVSESIGYITGVNGTEGDDKLTFTGRGVYNVETGSGDDSVIAKSALIAGVSLGDGKDSLKASGGLIADVDGGAGNDDIQLTGSLIMNVTGGNGDDTIKAAGKALIGIDGGDGNDTMYLEGARIFASGGKGNDSITIHQTDKEHGIAEYAFAAGDGQDTIATDGPLSLRLSGYKASDLTVSRDQNNLVITMKGSDDKITVSLGDGNKAGSAEMNFQFAMDKGQTVLKIS